MRILIDLQGNQNNSRERGIGRATLSLAKGIIRNAGNHQVFVLLNELFEDTIDPIINELSNVLPQENIIKFSVPSNLQESKEENEWRVKAAELIRERFINELNADAVIICSLFEGVQDSTVSSVNIIPSTIITAVMLHDLIPLMDPDRYLGSGIFREWYFRKIESAKRADLLLGISSSATQEAIDLLGVKPDNIINMGSGVDTQFYPKDFTTSQKNKILGTYGIKRKFIMHASALDPRKNFEGLVRSFAAIPKNIRSEFQLVLVFKIKSKKDSDNFYSLAKQVGLSKDELILTGYITDQQLIELYSLCYLFVFPSFHEGFGLPVLEAMSCGAPTIGSNVTSIPEVIGMEEALFDPSSITSMAQKIEEVMVDEDFWRFLKKHALTQSKKFSWDKTAKIAIHGIEELYQQRKLHKANLSSYTYNNDLKYFAWQLNAINSNVSPSEDDYIQVAQSLHENQLFLDTFNANVKHTKKLIWRLEGPFDSSYSLALVNREAARAIKALGHEVILHSTEGFGDFEPNPKFLEKNPDLAEMNRLVEFYPQSTVNLSSRNLYPPRVEDMHSHTNILHHYAWEESGFPQEWVENFNNNLDGMTCTSKHVEKIMIDNGVTVPLINIGNGVDHWERIIPSPTYKVIGRKFKLLHVSTCLPRKGPLALLDGYGLAFTIDDDVSLIVKTTPNEHNKIHEWINNRRSENSKYPHVIVIEEDITDAELKALYSQCDVLVQPACAEGFGLPMAEAMLSGIPVITTGWSGQLEFCTHETAWLVDYEFSRAKTHFDLYYSAWAKVDTNDLANKMKEVYNLPVNERTAKAKLGRSLLLKEFTWLQTASKAIIASKKWQNNNKLIVPKIGWVSTWNTRCGIATYSEHLINHLPNKDNVIILASPMNEPNTADSINAFRKWQAGPVNNGLKNLSSIIAENCVNTLIIQFNNGLFNFDELGDFIEDQLSHGLIVIVMMHSTNLYLNFGAKLHHALEKCNRILVHAIQDLNNLKSANLIDNVCLFPHGVLKYQIADSKPLRVSDESLPVIATYGFCFPHKGLIEIIQAVALLRQQGTPVRLRMVNAEYPSEESAALIVEIKNLVKRFAIEDLVELYNDFLPDEKTFELLKAADLLVFAYQNTEESASGAVRYGLALSKPVIVTPLRIFDDLGDVVFRFEGTNYNEIAVGIKKTIFDINNFNSAAQNVFKSAERWRTQHDYKVISNRLYNISKALLASYESLNYVYAASHPSMRVDCGVIQGKKVITSNRSGRLLFGPFINLPSGNYLVKVHGEIFKLGSSAYIDVVTNSGNTLLGLKSLSNNKDGCLACTSIFSQEKIISLEVRIFVDESTVLEITKIEIIPEFNSENLSSPDCLKYLASDFRVKSAVGIKEDNKLFSSGNKGEFCYLEIPPVTKGQYILKLYGKIETENNFKAIASLKVGKRLLTQPLKQYTSELITVLEVNILNEGELIFLTVNVEKGSELTLNLIELAKNIESKEITFLASDSRLYSSTGRKDNGVIYSTGRKGHLMYGPYIDLKKGTYRLVLLGNLSKIKGIQPYIEIVADNINEDSCKHILKVSNDLKNIADFNFTLERDVTNFEVRIWAPAIASIEIKSFTIYEVSESMVINKHNKNSLRKILDNFKF